jgi:ATP adenylyltransferase
MKSGDLIEFLQNRMSMSHIYQPLLIKSLIDAGGTATIRQLALQFLNQDESQIQYYENRIKQMPLKVLSKHGIVSKQSDLVSLNVQKLTLQEKSLIKMICEQKIQQYVVKKGLAIWDHRMLDSDPVSDVLRLRVLEESGGRCALCGANKKESPLHVDHIKPRSKGGKTEYANLQVLCARCNQAKSNKSATDYRKEQDSVSLPDCRFCPEHIGPRAVDEYETVWAIEDGYPVSSGHHLIIPKRHTPDWFSMTQHERDHAGSLIRIVKNRLRDSDRTITGFNIGMNCGASAGQTIFHAHIHLIPRRDGDTPDPTGGVRGVIPDKMNYKIRNGCMLS